MNTRAIGLAMCLASVEGWERAAADVVTLLPFGDAFVGSANPGGNFGGAGIVGGAAPGLARGEFQGVMKFDLSLVRGELDSAHGEGRWRVTGVSLRLNATVPNNPMFNPQSAGRFGVEWMRSNAWEEGSGTPNQPGGFGVTFASLAGLVGAGDVVIGAFDFDGATAGAATYVLSPTAELREEMRLGRVVSLRLFAASETISYQFNSRNFVNGPTWPVMEVAAEALCAGDFNGGDGASVQDIFDFLAAYFAGLGSADVNRSGDVTVQDIFDFLAAYFEGCE
ncbi:MAG: hypothetical protein IT438_05790 [Phycisphaerales bacterium]|nr:hypothetical protein [Phycisphaerales bacterium]